MLNKLNNYMQDCELRSHVKYLEYKCQAHEEVL